MYFVLSPFLVTNVKNNRNETTYTQQLPKRPTLAVGLRTTRKSD